MPDLYQTHVVRLNDITLENKENISEHIPNQGLIWTDRGGNFQWTTLWFQLFPLSVVNSN